MKQGSQVANEFHTLETLAFLDSGMEPGDVFEH